LWRFLEARPMREELRWDEEVTVKPFDENFDPKKGIERVHLETLLEI
jgi:hypothetical protein